MSKEALRLFSISFALTLLLFGFLAAFLVVDNSSSSRERLRPAAALSSAPLDPLHYELQLLGKEYRLSLKRLNDAEWIRQKYACLLTPRLLLSAEQLWDAGKISVENFYSWYLEHVFQKETEERIPG